MGGDRLTSFIDGLYAAAIAAERLEGGTGWAAAGRKQHFLQHIGATIARANAAMTEQLSRGIARRDRPAKRPRTTPIHTPTPTHP